MLFLLVFLRSGPIKYDVGASSSTLLIAALILSLSLIMSVLFLCFSEWQHLIRSWRLSSSGLVSTWMEISRDFQNCNREFEHNYKVFNRAQFQLKSFSRCTVLVINGTFIDKLQVSLAGLQQVAASQDAKQGHILLMLKDYQKILKPQAKLRNKKNPGG